MPQDQVSGVTDSGMQESSISEQAAGQGMDSAEAVVSQLTRIYFDFDQFTLSSAARDTLAANAAIINAAPGVKVRIEGHCDERGSDEYNLALGEKRAQATRDYLVSLGVAGDRLETISYGEELPLDPASNEDAWAKNRRAEFKAIR
jgi:peptidoglycan-associated lipoprotein